MASEGKARIVVSMPSLPLRIRTCLQMSLSECDGRRAQALHLPRQRSSKVMLSQRSPAMMQVLAV